MLLEDRGDLGEDLVADDHVLALPILGALGSFEVDLRTFLFLLLLGRHIGGVVAVLLFGLGRRSGNGAVVTGDREERACGDESESGGPEKL